MAARSRASLGRGTATYGPQGALADFGYRITPAQMTYGPQGAANYFGNTRTSPIDPRTMTYGPQGAMNYFGPNAPLGAIVGLRPNELGNNVNAPTAAQIAQQAANAQAASAAAAAAAAQRRAGQSFLDRAAGLEGQIEALKYALSDKGFRASLEQNLTDAMNAQQASIDLLKESHAQRAQGFLDTASDTEKATSAQAGASFENLVRERQDTLSNLMLQGAGETDTLKAMVMAARNFRNNQTEGNRAYYDTMRTIKTGLTDLNLDTRTAMQNSYQGLESERDRLWQDFYNRQSETYTQLGNVYGQQGDYYISAEENDVSSGGKRGTAQTAANNAFMDAARLTGQSYVQQGVPQWLQEWKGIPAPETKQANTDLAAATTFEPLGQAEGAGLRSW